MLNLNLQFRVCHVQIYINLYKYTVNTTKFKFLLSLETGSLRFYSVFTYLDSEYNVANNMY